MRKKDFLFNFLMFSMLILIILIVTLIFKEYENKYGNIKTQLNKETNIENNIVQSDVEKVKRDEVNTEKEYNMLRKEPTQEIQENKEVQKDIETQQVNYEELIVNSADYNSNYVNAIIKQLSYMPPKMLSDFKDKGWKICIVSENEMYSVIGKRQLQMYSIDKSQFIKGYTKIEDKTIYLTYHSITLRDNTIIHEIGHYYDIENAWLSCTEEYRNIYEKEKSSLNSTTTQINSNRELFAETFEYVILEETQYEDLETYQYVENIIYHN